VAYLLDEQGRVAAPVARGSDQVLPLARKLAGEESGPALQVEPQTQQVIDFPDFECPDLGVVLVHWNFDCGFCATIAPELARLEPKLEERNFRLVLLAKGDSQFNRERASTAGLKCRILLLQDRKTPRPFEHRGTPVAYLLDENGRTASPFASGRDEVLSLVRGAAGEDVGAARNAGSARAEPDGQPRLISTPGRHRINLPGFILRGEIGFGDVIKRVTSAFGIKTCLGCERRAAWLNRWLRFSGAIGEGLKAGTRAPVFRLPDLQGRMISLKEYQGRRVLLVFSDPNCGPCDELAPHLVRLHEEHEANGLDLILVGHGDADENRRKAEQYGFRFPVLLQPNWQLSDKYGIRATPVAFLIKEDGVIAEDAAAGRDPIMALAQTGAAVLI
jgi:peroxiredoxin